jgi:pectate lyase
MRHAFIVRGSLLACALASACSGTAGTGGSGTGGGGGGTSGVAGSSGGTTGAAGTTGVGGTTGSAGTTGAGGTAGTAGAGGVAGSGAGGAGTGGGRGGAAGTGTAGAGGRGGGAGTGTAGATGTAGTTGTGGCMTPPDPSPLIGWASLSGNNVTTTTGGGTATPTVVTTQADFINAVKGTTPAVIYVNGVFPNGAISIGSNKTIVGLCGAELHGHLAINGSSNVIIRNIKIVGFGVGNCALDPTYNSAVGCSSGYDAVTVESNAHHIWFDHCDISDGTDGNLDVTSGSDFVTISWTKFHYTPRTDPTGNDNTGAEGHRFSNLVGSDDNVPGDAGHLNITWHHDWWADNVNQRMPRTRAGKIHMLNNLFTSTGNSVCTNAGQGAQLLVEGSVYSGVAGPLQITQTGMMNAPKTGANANVFTNTTGNTTANGTVFTPMYTYTVDPASGIQAAVMAGAGPH